MIFASTVTFDTPQTFDNLTVNGDLILKADVFVKGAFSCTGRVVQRGGRLIANDVNLDGNGNVVNRRSRGGSTNINGNANAVGNNNRINWR